MSKVQQLSDTLARLFGARLKNNVIDVGEVTIEVAPSDLVTVCQALRDEDSLSFDMLIDLCGVDYLEYGDSEWSTKNNTSTGFSRAVEAGSHGFMKFGDAPPRINNELPRYGVVYHLLSVKNNQRLRVRVFAENEHMPVVPSVIDIWNAANWFEREAFDLYGIHFDGHPDLRRILTDYGFVGHPFRKDFPLSGHVEMRYDLEQKRVIYQPVSIEPRVLVPRVIRDDNRYHDIEDEAADA